MQEKKVTAQKTVDILQQLLVGTGDCGGKSLAS